MYFSETKIYETDKPWTQEEVLTQNKESIPEEIIRHSSCAEYTLENLLYQMHWISRFPNFYSEEI